MAKSSVEIVDSGRQSILDSVIGREYGYRVHRVEPGSPGHAAGLQSIIDYIVVADGVRLDHDDGNFVQMIANSKDAQMRLCVFDTHTLRTRETMLTPSGSWGGSGLLGITIRFDVTQEVSKHTLHVLDVFDNSPASTAGLDAYNDYILGVGDLLYDGPDEFGEIVMHNENRSIRLYVYSVRTEIVRDVMITPTRSWGGEGYLGCGVGAGYLHALPPRRDLHDSSKPQLPQPPPQQHQQTPLISPERQPLPALMQQRQEPPPPSVMVQVAITPPPRQPPHLSESVAAAEPPTEPVSS